MMLPPRPNRGPFDSDETSDGHFEQLSKIDGQRFWYARDLMTALGYDSWADFKRPLNKSIGACATLNISISDNFIQHKRMINGREREDFKLTRFACFLTAMNCDPKKPNVAAAQAYFVSLAMVIQDLQLPPECVDRIVIREEISDREKSLAATAKAAGVIHFGLFQDAGYRGMYNMGCRELREKRRIPQAGRPLLDYMGKEELAANLFRLTLTDGRIQKEQARGQLAAEYIAEQVGRKVRQTMIEETGNRPEDLPPAADIKLVHKGIKETQKGFGTLLDNVEAEATAEAEMRLLATSPETDLNCPECRAGSTTSHKGSAQCTSGSLASGGTVAHCGCDYCAFRLQ